MLKVQAMEQRLLEQTYTATSLPALSAVAHHLEVAEAEAEAKHLQVGLTVWAMGPCIVGQNSLHLWRDPCV